MNTIIVDSEVMKAEVFNDVGDLVEYYEGYNGESLNDIIEMAKHDYPINKTIFLTEEIKATTLVEKRIVERDYGFGGIEAIIDHPTYGRLMIMDGYGGENTPKGGAVRWEHGVAVELNDDDTFISIGRAYHTITDLVYSKKVKDWDGRIIEQIAWSLSI